MEPSTRVLEAPGFADAAIVELEEIDLGHSLESSSGCWMPFAGVGAGADEPGGHGLSLGDEVDDPHLQVGERVPEWTDPRLGLVR